jgi:hypothetical protein
MFVSTGPGLTTLARIPYLVHANFGPRKPGDSLRVEDYGLLRGVVGHRGILLGAPPLDGLEVVCHQQAGQLVDARFADTHAMLGMVPTWG